MDGGGIAADKRQGKGSPAFPRRASTSKFGTTQSCHSLDVVSIANFFPVCFTHSSFTIILLSTFDLTGSPRGLASA